jgi:4-hydroxybenzoate polyprenyltransferase
LNEPHLPGASIERSSTRFGGAPLALARAMRPQQWSKNLLVFVPMLAGQGWGEAEAWKTAILAFWALSFTASAVYLVNDIVDIEADRAHPRKRTRPFASGALSPAAGLIAACVLVALGLSLSVLAGVLGFAILYLFATTLYTFWLKRVALVDVFLLAGLYAVRIVLGGAATGFFPSDWLLAFSCFFFLSLALVKRVTEMREAPAGGTLSRRGYFNGDADILTAMGVASGFIAALVLALYLQDDANAVRYQEPFLLWALPAVCLLWTCRLWLKTHRGEMHDDPILFAARDKWSWVLALCAGLAFVAAGILPTGFIPG